MKSAGQRSQAQDMSTAKTLDADAHGGKTQEKVQ